MSYIFAPIPYFRCLVRREFTTNLKRRKGEYINAIAVGVRMQRGLSIYFQTWLQDKDVAGAQFLLPIQALCFKPCPRSNNAAVQPWDVFGPTFTCTRIDLFHRSRAYLLPNRWPGRYMMTFDFAENEIADDLEQHKHLHLIALDNGWLAAAPNNRVLIEDKAFHEHDVCPKRPDFESLTPEFFAE